MKKKYSVIFFVLAVILFILFGLYKYTDLFISHEKPIENDDPKIERIISYDYIKSYDMAKKTKISFPVFDNLIISNVYSNEYYKSFDSDKLVLTAGINEYDGNLDNYFNKELNGYKERYHESEITSTNITCDYLCKRIQIHQENKISFDIIKMYIKTSDQEIGVITYQMFDKEFSQDMIKEIINNIKITYDATYKNGIIEEDKLIIKFKSGNEDIITIRLDGNIYEEMESELNTTNSTILHNKTNDSKISLQLRSKTFGLSIKEEVDMYHNMTDPGSNVTEIMVDDKKVYQYDLGNHNSYAYIINDDYALLISPDSDSTSISDFLNFNS